MSARADERLQRLLLAFPLMADEPALTVDALAARVGTTVDVLRRDFASLERYDVPGGWIDAVQVMIDGKHVSLTSAHFKRPQRLSRPEQLALELGLSMLQRELPVDEQPAVADVRQALRGVSVRRAQTVTEGGAASAAAGTRDDVAHAVESVRPPELEALSVLHQALEHRRVVQLTYRRPDEPAAGTRRVRPYELVRADANVYVVGFCEKAEALRVFRLDRVEAAVLTGENFTMPDDFRVADVLANGRVFTHDTPREQLVIRYSARVARWIAEREGMAHTPDTPLTVTYTLADEHWAVRHVLQYGADAVVLSPPAVRERVAAVLAELLAASD